MTDEMKLKMMETLAKSGMSVGQFVMENNGTMTYNDHRGAEERKKDDACAPASKDAIMEYVGRLRPVVREQYRDRYDEIWEGILEISQVKAVIYNEGKLQDCVLVALIEKAPQADRLVCGAFGLSRRDVSIRVRGSGGV